MKGVLAIMGATAVAFAACTPDYNQQLKTRSAFDLKCPEASLKLTDLGTDTMGVSGCGRQATYVWRKTDNFGGGDWVMNNALSENGVSPGAPN